jgi:hypothetical protein
MAIKTNTTKSIKQTSSVLAGKCEATQKNLKKLCKDAGLGDEAKMVKTMVPRIPGSDDDVIFVGLNGVDFYFLRGESVNMPEAVMQILHNCGHI